MFQKIKPFRSKKYLEFVRSLPCFITGKTDRVVAHHIIDVSMVTGMGTKPSDLFCIPLDALEHQKLHSNPELYNIDQKAEALKTIEKAVNAGVLIMGTYET